MSDREKFGLVIIVVLVLLAGASTVLYVQEREGLIRAQMESQAIQREIKARDDARKERDDRAEQEIADLKAQAAKVRTVPQAVAAFPNVVQLPSPIVEQKNPALPDAPSQTVIPQESVVPLFQHLAQCKQDTVALGVCRTDLKGADETRASLEKDRDHWKQLAEGGTKMQRVKRIGLPIACASAGAALGAAKDARTAAISAGVGGLLCALFAK